MPYSSNVQAFLRDIRDEAKEHNVKLKYGRGKFLRLDGHRVGGYFDEETLAVARGRPLNIWLGTLAHESCHMDQWIENCPYWQQATDHAYTIQDNFVEGIQQHGNTVKSAFNKILMIEADCERRAVKKIKKYSLPVDITRYVQLANANLYSYLMLLEYGIWNTKKPMNQCNRLITQMPKTLRIPEDYNVADMQRRIDISIFEDYI